MPSTPVIAILDIGKTNKKLTLFDSFYNPVWETGDSLPESKDEDGDTCEDLDLLNNWIFQSLNKSGQEKDFVIKSVNYSAYGASFVYIGGNGKPIAPLYNYLKPFPEIIKRQFYENYGGELKFSMETASPVLGSLNSGMQLYRMKYEKPEKFALIRYALHLPQYLSWLLTEKTCSDITSIGCHTNLWNFSRNYYHDWVNREGIIQKLAPIQSSGIIHPVLENASIAFSLSKDCVSGIGLHDSSASLIPYLEYFHEPFILISTGTWCISMNPFNNEPLTEAELQNDCLCYLTYKGTPLKSSRFFAGPEHAQQIERIAEYFQKEKNYFQSVEYDSMTASILKTKEKTEKLNYSDSRPGVSVFAHRELSGFQKFEEAYHRLMMDIMERQRNFVKYILSDSIKKIYVDGGFCKNPVYMNLLANTFPDIPVFAATIAQGSAIGAAMAIHDYWNEFSLPHDLIRLQHYPVVKKD
jgi:sugar (pentulose or hexulose) kinase